MSEQCKPQIAAEARALLAGGDPAGCAALLQGMPAPENADGEEARLWALGQDLLCRALFQLGRQAEGVAALEKAAAFYSACPQVEKTPGDMLFLASLLQNLCFARLEQKCFAGALDAGKQALALAEKHSPNSPAVAEALFRLSAVYYRQRDFANARRLTLRALEIWQNAQNLKMAGECLNNLGRIHEELGQLEEGIAWHEKAVELRRGLPDAQDLAFSLGNLGVARAANGDWRGARSGLEEAVALYERLDLGGCRDCGGFRANLEICKAALGERET